METQLRDSLIITRTENNIRGTVIRNIWMQSRKHNPVLRRKSNFLHRTEVAKWNVVTVENGNKQHIQNECRDEREQGQYDFQL